MNNERVAKELLKLAKTITSGCEKLPEGGMRENCEKKKEEGKKNKEDKKAVLAGQLVKLARELTGQSREATAERDDPDYQAAFWAKKTWMDMRDSPRDGWGDHRDSLLNLVKKTSDSRSLLKLWEEVDDAISNMNTQQNKALKAIYELQDKAKDLI